MLCSRDGDGNAGYRVTLHQLEVCELNEDSVGYANGLRNNQRVTHVDHQPVSNWEEYRDRAHGRDSFVLTVALLILTTCGCRMHGMLRKCHMPAKRTPSSRMGSSWLYDQAGRG